MKIDRVVLLQLFFVIVLSFAALGFYVVEQKGEIQSSRNKTIDLSKMSTDIDREVDSLLIKSHIEKQWWKKRQMTFSRYTRIERKVLVPSAFNILEMNRALNTMAHDFGGRAIGSENLKDNSVTVHIKLEKYILQSIIFKTNPLFSAAKDGKTKPRKR